MGDPPDGLIETRKWYKNVMAVIALVAAIAGGVYGLIQLLESSFLSPTKVRTNIEIVVDRSKAMAASFDGTSKWDAAVAAVGRTLADKVAKRDNLALRQFGGPCLGDNSRLVVDFAQNNERAVENALRGVRLGGETTLAGALVEATGDFNDPERFGADVNKSIIVITGGGDPCHDRPNEVVRDRLRDVVRGDEAIRISFRLIGAGLTPTEQADLAELAAETGGRVSFATDPAALNRAVRKAVEEERATANNETGSVGRRYLGCFQDGGARDLDGYSYTDDAMTNDKCVGTCAAKGFRYASTQYSRECYCGDAFGRYDRVHSRECSYTCVGDPSEFCGGYWRNSVFEIEGGARRDAAGPQSQGYGK